MNTLAFTLGVLSVIITAFVVVLVWGIVKVVKQQKQIDSNHKWFEDSINNIWRSKEEDRRINYEREQSLQRHLDERFKEFERTIDSIHRDVSSRLDSETNSIHRRIDEAERQAYQSINDQITDSVTQTKSYTDSRIDKLIDAYFEYGELNKKKQVIKG